MVNYVLHKVANWKYIPLNWLDDGLYTASQNSHLQDFDASSDLYQFMVALRIERSRLGGMYYMYFYAAILNQFPEYEKLICRLGGDEDSWSNKTYCIGNTQSLPRLSSGLSLTVVKSLFENSIYDQPFFNRLLRQDTNGLYTDFYTADSDIKKMAVALTLFATSY